jgi:hypothetical protein
MQEIPLTDHMRALHMFHYARSIYQAAVALLLAEEAPTAAELVPAPAAPAAQAAPPVQAPAPRPAVKVTAAMLAERLLTPAPVIRAASEDNAHRGRVEAAARSMWKMSRAGRLTPERVERELDLAGVGLEEAYAAVHARRDWSRERAGGRLARVLASPEHMERVREHAAQGRAVAKAVLAQVPGRASSVRVEAQALGVTRGAIYNYLRNLGV